MDVKGRAVMVRARFLRPQGSLCDRCATAPGGPPLTSEPRRPPGQAEAGAGGCLPVVDGAAGRRLGLEFAEQLVDLAD
jgi:hypothetical protein